MSNDLNIQFERHDKNTWDVEYIRKSILDCMVHLVGKDPELAWENDWYKALVLFLKGILAERRVEFERKIRAQEVKRVYYLSLEYLIGRNLHRTLADLNMTDAARQALAACGKSLEEILDCEAEAGLGNGGLGRLAACIVDSMASQGYPGVGYGIRYQFGMFKQSIENGLQVEHPESWLRFGSPWELERRSLVYEIKFKGRIFHYRDKQGRNRCQWVETEDCEAQAFDVLLSGYRTPSLSYLRLWNSRASREFDLHNFNAGNYIDAVKSKIHSENLSKVLYPDDSTSMGQELRLMQEYFFVSASLQDIFAQHVTCPEDLQKLPDNVAIHLNDTHPATAIPEMMRLLLDDHGLDYENAWDITRRVFSYTNHTLLPEALETWSLDVFGKILPRHLDICYLINHHHMNNVKYKLPGDTSILGRMSLFDDNSKRVRMANLSIVGSHTVNGVAELHSQLMQKGMFADFVRLSPGKLTNVTNGITPIRWLVLANPGLANLITDVIGGDWVHDLTKLKKLADLADDHGFQDRFMAVKKANKVRLAHFMSEKHGIRLNVDFLFDVQVKRMHEYKRQLLNLLHVLTRYIWIRDGIKPGLLPRTVLFGGKAAPAYHMAKLIIRLINDVADMVRNDPVVANQLQLAFIPNYNVSAAEIIMPACELSEQISTAGLEASGTGNMKFALNGALTIGTMDGANIEIRNEVGPDNIFIFGLESHRTDELWKNGYNPGEAIAKSADLKRILEMIRDGYFCPEEPNRYQPIYDALTMGDHYLLTADYADYIACQERVDQLYRNPRAWARKSIINVANMGFFSIDRTVQTYAEKVWKIKPVK
ncbi:MAG: glycogen phosphorylase [Magnetococcales bacterium]|nr:glycogen phosphorylase [Magnetococcales bacterium]HIJ85317.1 glycogen/starch/alpha-glucan phosphorylase [Magnetococcales bacterium]